MKKTILKHVVYMTKLFATAFIIQCMTMSFLLAWNGNAQVKSIEDVKVYLSLHDVEVERAFKELEKHTNYNFVFATREIRDLPLISFEGHGQSLYVLLLDIATQASLNFKQVDLNIHVKKSEVDRSVSIVEQLDIVVTGTVVDSDGEPIPGVTVSIPGTSIGTATDINGKYSLTIPEGVTLVFSFIGFQTQNIEVGDRSVINVTLLEDMTSLDEVVVVGYGTQRKKDLTGAVQSANLDFFRESPNHNILQSLSGSAPGLHVGKTNTAGGEPSIQIRGQNTLSGSTSPLIVLDGMIYRGSVGDINPNDVESIDILKDASSKAVYGAQAANGVIIITTKSGKRQKPMLNVSTYYSIQTPANSLRSLNREEFIQAAKDHVWRKAYLPPDYLEENPDFVVTDNVQWNANTLDGYNKGIDYDWIENSTSQGAMYNTDFSVTGGGEDITYMLSFNYTKQEGWVMNDTYNRKSGRINLDFDITEWLTIGTNSFLSFSDFSGDSPAFSVIAHMPPINTPYVGNEESGEYELYPDGITLNPFIYGATDEKNIRNHLMAKAFAIVRHPKFEDLTYTANYSYDYGWYPHVYANEYIQGGAGRAYGSYSNNTGYIFDNIFNYDGQFGDHRVGATLLAGIEKREGYGFEADGSNFADMTLSYYALETAGNQTISSSGFQEQYAYQMARANYNFKNKYLVTGTIRRDGYSGFSNNKKTFYFPSFGLAWVPSEENFWNNANLNFFKLRASYGVNGNTVNRYSSLARVSRSNQYVFEGQSALGQKITSLANNNLSWEKTKSYNFGVDIAIFNNKVMAHLDYYTSKTTGLIWDLSLPQITGFSSITSNVGEIGNKGIEMSFHADNILNTSAFKWSSSLFFDANKNRINKLIGLDSDGDGKEDDLIASGLFIGESIHSIYDYEIDGIWQSSDLDKIPSDSHVGMYKYKDLDGDGVLTPTNDRRILGRQEPAYSFGIQNSLTYKQLSLTFFIKSIQGGKNGYMKHNEPDHRGGEVLTYRSWYAGIDYWTPSNTDAKFRWMGGDARTYGLGTYQQRNFIRLQDISLAYDFNQGIIQKYGVDNLKVYLSGKDLITITDWLGWDPETGQGLIFGGYPVMKSITLGLKVTF